MVIKLYDYTTYKRLNYLEKISFPALAGALYLRALSVEDTFTAGSSKLYKSLPNLKPPTKKYF